MTWKRTAIAFALGAAGLAAAPLAVAQQADPRGFYVGGSIGQMEAEGSCPGGFSCDFKDTAWKLFGGYRLHRNFAAEVFYADWGEISVSTGAVSARSEARTIGVAGLAILPVGQAFELFGKLGLGSTKIDTTATGPGATISGRDSGRDFLFGLGAAYNFTRNLGVRAEWQRMDDSEINAFLIGLQYKFR